LERELKIYTADRRITQTKMIAKLGLKSDDIGWAIDAGCDLGLLVGRGEFNVGKGYEPARNAAGEPTCWCAAPTAWIKGARKGNKQRAERPGLRSAAMTIARGEPILAEADAEE